LPLSSVDCGFALHSQERERLVLSEKRARPYVFSPPASPEIGPFRFFYSRSAGYSVENSGIYKRLMAFLERELGVLSLRPLQPPAESL